MRTAQHCLTEGVRFLVNCSFAYAVAGLLSGLYYRELTKAKDFEGHTQLAVVHTHLLTLGVVFLLIVLAMERLFALSDSPIYRWFLGTFNGGTVITAAMLTVHGTMQVLGRNISPAISGIAGLGHILLTVAFVLFFLCLRSVVRPAATSVNQV